MTDEVPLQSLVEHLRWLGLPGRGGMDAYIRVRDAALRDAHRRTADELSHTLHEGNEALLALAERLRQRCLAETTPDDVLMPEWPVHRPVPELDPTRARREQVMGYALGLARSAALIHEAAGGHF
jgi:hypothetical protein